MINFQFRFGALSLEEWAEALSPCTTEEPEPSASKQASGTVKDPHSSEPPKTGSSKPNGLLPDDLTDTIRSKEVGNGVHASPVSSASSGTTSTPAAPAPPTVTLSWAERVAAHTPRVKSAAATVKTITPSPPLVRSAPPPPLPDRRIRGLVNGGNTCFINVILQALIACDPFRRFLLGRRHVKSNPPLVQKFVSLAVDMTVAATGAPEQVHTATNSSKTLPNLDEPLLPDWSHDIFPSSMPCSSLIPCPTENGGNSAGRRGGSQEDAQEFLTFLLNQLHEELLASETRSADVNVNGYISGRANELGSPRSRQGMEKFAAGVESGGEWQEMNRRGRAVQVRGAVSSPSAITKIFGGVLRSELKRPRAKTSITREPFLSLSLDIDSGMTRHVEDALANYFQMERVEGYTAEDSQEAVDAKKQVLLETLPPVLILHLKRFSHNTRTGALNKVGRRLDFPETLSIPAYICHGSKTGPSANERIYRLSSVITHVGKELAGGHYFCDVRLGKGPKAVWASCDDSKVSMINIQNVLRRQAYLLFYTRICVGD